MSFSSLFVVSNALRLRFFKPKSDKNVNKKEEDIKMTKTIKIKGMMCSHCTGRVEQALNALDGVEATVTLDNGGQAVVTMADGVAVETLTKTVTDAGYEVVSVD